MKLKYLDTECSIETRVNDLLRRMTIDEKIDQMSTTGCNSLGELAAKLRRGKNINISKTFVYHGFDVNDYNALQRHQVEETRLGIPFILASENTHGVSHPLCTIFPTTGCIAATFDREIARKVAKFSGKEARALGITQVYAPNVDISWDLRWGRVEETFGEDPCLTSEMGVEFVRSFQNEGVAATIKHYIAYGLGEGGLNLAPAHIGVRDVREYMLPPFENCIKRGKAWSVMPSYNEVDGVPIHSSTYWMKNVLREELGFDGMVITDYGASNMLYDFHKIVERPVDAGIILCDNEIDMEGCGYFGYNEEFREMVKSGKYPISRIDKCVGNILRLKFRLGLFENPYAAPKNKSKLHTQKHIALAREVAEKGTVLLKNDGILPLNGKEKIALIGPNADISQLGDYIYYGYFDDNYKGECVAEESLSMKGVLERENARFIYAKGCDFDKTDEKMLTEAQAAARKADVVILALGTNSKGGKYCGNQNDLAQDGNRNLTVTSGEGYDLHSIELAPHEQKLFERIKYTQKPVILILYGGKPLAITKQADDCSAILFAFGCGEQGNEALYNILIGKVNPSGKLPITFPRSTGHLPCFYNYKPSARGRFYRQPGNESVAGKDYVFENPKALYPFGFGLSYTSFSYSNLTVEKTGKSCFNVKADVTNTGNRDGDEIVLLFVSTEVQRVTPVVKKLRAFTRVSLSKGETKTVRFRLNKEDFTYIGTDMKKHVAVGAHDILVGGLVERITI